MNISVSQLESSWNVKRFKVEEESYNNSNNKPTTTKKEWIVFDSTIIVLKDWVYQVKPNIIHTWKPKMKDENEYDEEEEKNEEEIFFIIKKKMRMAWWSSDALVILSDHSNYIDVTWVCFLYFIFVIGFSFFHSSLSFSLWIWVQWHYH